MAIRLPGVLACHSHRLFLVCARKCPRLVGDFPVAQHYCLLCGVIGRERYRFEFERIFRASLE